jgi:hypothetical protein
MVICGGALQPVRGGLHGLDGVARGRGFAVVAILQHGVVKHDAVEVSRYPLGLE